MKLHPSPPPGPILGLYPNHDAGAYYRVQVPLSVVPGATWAHLEDVTHEQLTAAETVIMYRCYGPVDDVRAAFADLRGRWRVKRILVDYDDAMFVRHPVFEVRPKLEPLRGLKLALELADGVIVQSDALRRYYRRYTSQPIAVVPNYVRPDDWAPIEMSVPYELSPGGRWRRPPVIVLAGSPSHRYDWDQVLPALAWLRDVAPDVEIRVIGCPHPDARALATDYQPWHADISSYARALAGADIGLAPLQETLFNRCKSRVKAYELALSGAAVIGSPTQYAELLADGRGRVVPHEARRDWLVAICSLLAKPAQIRAAADALREHVLAHFDVRHHSAQLQHVYTTSEGSAWQRSLPAPMDLSRSGRVAHPPRSLS